jgi:hypothetical protein
MKLRDPEGLVKPEACVREDADHEDVGEAAGQSE